MIQRKRETGSGGLLSVTSQGFQRGVAEACQRSIMHGPNPLKIATHRFDGAGILTVCSRFELSEDIVVLLFERHTLKFIERPEHNWGAEWCTAGIRAVRRSSDQNRGGFFFVRFVTRVRERIETKEPFSPFSYP
jgi:hypothetical protein